MLGSLTQLMQLHADVVGSLFLPSVEPICGGELGCEMSLGGLIGGSIVLPYMPSVELVGSLGIPPEWLG